MRASASPPATSSCGSIVISSPGFMSVRTEPQIVERDGEKLRLVPTGSRLEDDLVVHAVFANIRLHPRETAEPMIDHESDRGQIGYRNGLRRSLERNRCRERPIDRLRPATSLIKP